MLPEFLLDHFAIHMTQTVVSEATDKRAAEDGKVTTSAQKAQKTK